LRQKQIATRARGGSQAKRQQHRLASSMHDPHGATPANLAILRCLVNTAGVQGRESSLHTAFGRNQNSMVIRACLFGLEAERKKESPKTTHRLQLREGLPHLSADAASERAGESEYERARESTRKKEREKEREGARDSVTALVRV